jgi:hypothetical protein
MNNSALWLAILVFVVLGLRFLWSSLPQDKSARRSLSLPEKPRYVPTPRPAVIRVPTLTDKVKAQMIRVQSSGLKKCSAKSMLKMLRQRGDVVGPMKVRTVQVLMDQESRQGTIARLRPRVGSPRQRRNGTRYQLAAA